VDWSGRKPRRIVAIDLSSFSTAWRQIGAHLERTARVRPSFLVGRLELLPLSDVVVDLAVSDAVFEHCQALDAVVRETFRVLRPGGYVYAGYGPLWYSYGGDHFAGRGGLTHGFSHLELPPADYREYVRQYRTDDEDTQAGIRFIDLDLFSRLTTRQYLTSFEQAGFDIVDLVLELSIEALRFRRTWPRRFERIVTTNVHLMPDDLIIKANLVILRKPP